MKFEEQNINFDFHPNNHQIFMYVQENDKYEFRY